MSPLLSIEALDKANIKTCFSTEYILVDNFVDSEFLSQSQEIFVNNKEVIETHDHLTTYINHPLMTQFAESDFKNALLERVNNMWDCNCINVQTSVNCIEGSGYLPIHEDKFYPGVPVRGILYLNGLYGTHFHETFDSSNIIEIGGMPGQLLLFKVNELGWHSAGLFKQTDDPRYVLSIMFNEQLK